MSTNAELQAWVKENLIDAPTAVQNRVQKFVNLAIRDLEDAFNFPVMRARTSLQTTTNQRQLGDMPDDFKEFRGRPYWLDSLGSPQFVELLPTEEDAFKKWAAEDLAGIGTPTDVGSPQELAQTQRISTDNTGKVGLSVYPLPDGLGPNTNEYIIWLPYWRYLSDLSADGDTNWFTTNGDLYIVAQATGHGFMQDWAEERAAGWFSIASGYRKKLVRKASYQSTQPIDFLAPRSDVHGERESWRRS